MSYGYEVFSPSSNRILGSAVTIGTVQVDVVSVPTGANTVSRSYPDWTGRTGLSICARGWLGSGIDLAWTYPSGVPTLTITRSAAASWETQRVAPVFVFMQ